MKRASILAAFAAAGLFTSNPLAAEDSHVVSFELVPPNAKIVNCLRDPSSSEQPSASVTVVRGDLNDTLHLHLEHFKPGLAFDMFTIQRSNLLSDRTPDPNFKNFGLAWYQSDLEVGKKGKGDVEIKTILLDQIFGFDPDVALPPTNTFHIGFWFNDPNDAVACGFNPAKPTPFNGEHKAGPLAMISVPDARTGLGPLCTNPEQSGSTFTCNP